jgi:putative lipoprotein (rSAM/lipoprotein system)
LRHLLTALLGVFSFLFGDCYRIRETPAAYGMPPAQKISGTVTSDEKPVPGFWVLIVRQSGSSPHTLTDKEGSFELSVYNGGPSYTLLFQDVDGPLNGEFSSQTVQWHSGDGPLRIVLEPME